MKPICIKYTPPIHGWLTLEVCVGACRVKIDASYVPNNPIQELIHALEEAAAGRGAKVWWNLEPDGYFMYFEPALDRMNFRLEFAKASDVRRALPVSSFEGRRSEVLLPFWRFLREFQSHGYLNVDWPEVCYARLPIIKENIQKR